MRLNDLHEGDVFTYDDFMKRKEQSALKDTRSEQQKYDDAFSKQTKRTFTKNALDKQDDEWTVINDCPWCGAENNDCDCLDNRMSGVDDDSVEITDTEFMPGTDDGFLGKKTLLDVNDKIKAMVGLRMYDDDIYIINLMIYDGGDRLARRLINDLIIEFPQKRIFISRVGDKSAQFFRKNYHVSSEGELNVIDESITEAKMAWARKGNKIVKKYRCTSGRRKGRIVSKPGQCSAPIDLKKRAQFKRTKARAGPRMARKAKKTKRINPASRRLKSLNRRR